MAAPRFSILTPVYKTPAGVLKKMLASVETQDYGDWELCLYDDASGEPHVREILAAAAARDSRIRVEFAERNSGIVGASNGALAMARGEFVDAPVPRPLARIRGTLHTLLTDPRHADAEAYRA